MKKSNTSLGNNMKNILVINLRKMVETQRADITTHGVITVGVIPCGDKFIVTDTDGVHQIMKENDPYEFYVHPNDGNIHIFPTSNGRMEISKLVDFALSKDDWHERKPLNNFIELFGARTRRNYRLLLASITECGETVSDYVSE